MNRLDIPLIILYVSECLVCAFAFHSLTRHLIYRVKSGVISAFMLSLWVFLFSYVLQTTASLVARLQDVYPVTSDRYESAVYYLWTISHVGTTASLIAIGALVIKRRFDIYITLKRK